MAVYAIKVWLSKSENDWFLYKDLEDNVIHTWSRREKAEEVMNLLVCNKAEITEDMQLIGGESLLDSMKLVEVCLALEDLADEHEFEFDWTSEAAMSKSRSMFRSVGALAEEFANQSEV